MKSVGFVVPDEDLKGIMAALSPFLHKMQHFAVNALPDSRNAPLQLEAPPKKAFEEFRKHGKGGAAPRRSGEEVAKVADRAADIMRERKLLRIKELQQLLQEPSEQMVRRIMDKLIKRGTVHVVGGDPKKGGYVFGLVAETRTPEEVH